MYCVQCGLQLPDDARFCDECGTSQRPRAERELAPRVGTAAPSQAAPAASPKQPEEAWVYCEIAPAKGILKGFHAVASSPSGSRVVAKRHAHKDFDPGHINRMAINNMVQRLIRDGWEPQPKGSAWYAHRFRRREGI